MKFTLKNNRFFFQFLILILGINLASAQQQPLKLWYDKPAAIWNEALPLGNGRLGAMVFGDPAKEKIQLNESTFWSGGPSSPRWSARAWSIA